MSGAGSESGAGEAARRGFRAAGRSRQGQGRTVESAEAVEANGPVVRGARGIRRKREKRGPPRILGLEPTGAVKIRHVPKKPYTVAPHGHEPTRLTDQKESWCRTTDKSQACLRFHLLDRLSSHQEQAKRIRSQTPLQRQPRARAFDTGQGVERMVKRS